MTPALGLLFVALLIIANGLFVAAEFALVSSKRGTVEEAANAGDKRAATALLAMSDLSFVLSAAQFGITATSLLVGLLAEDAVGGLIRPVIDVVGLPESTARTVSVALAFILSTGIQMVFGELAPKNLAIARPESTALRTVRFMRAFGIVFGPVIKVFDASAAAITRMLGFEVRHELDEGASPGELARIIQASAAGGSLTPDQGQLLARGIELGDTRVAEIMVPRPAIVWLQSDQTLEDLRAVARVTGHSRFPVQTAGTDETIGTVHVRHLLGVPREVRASTLLSEVVTDVLTVPEPESVRDLLREFRGTQRTFAMVVDEYGDTTGIVTIEDAVEELVGEIADEFDTEIASIRRTGAGRFQVLGAVRATRLGHEVGVDLPDGDFDTVAGFVLDQLGRLPEEGESLTYEGWEFRVSKLDGVRIAELDIARLPDAEVIA